MNVRRNEDWGDVGPMPSDAIIATTDREVGRLVEQCWADQRALPPVGLVGGDLRRALGGQRMEHDLRHDDDVVGAVLDIGAVIIASRRFAFTAHVIARSRWWSGPVFAVMNSEWLGDWIVAPRAHPGDGRFDLVEARLSVGDRLKARRRLLTGTHVPHPSIRVRTITNTTIEFGCVRSIYVDHELVGRAESMQIECVGGGLHTYV